MHRGLDEHQVKKRSFAFSLAYIKCFRTYSVYLSLRLPAQILCAGIHLCPLAVSRSCFGYSLLHLRTAAACLSRCIRHWRRSKAKPLRGRRGGSAAKHGGYLGEDRGAENAFNSPCRAQGAKAAEPRLARRIPPKKPRRRAKFLFCGVFYAIILAEKSLSQPQVAEVQAKAYGFVRRNPA